MIIHCFIYYVIISLFETMGIKKEINIFNLNFAGVWDPSLCSADDLFRANVICLEKQIDDPLTQINGVVAILDMKLLGFHHIRHFSPSHALKIVSLVQVSI